MKSVKRGLTGEKADSTDEFLVKKKDPLILPPDFENLPTPDERIEAEEEFFVLEKELEATIEQNSSQPSTVESSILKVKDKMVELNVVTGSEGRASNAGAGLFLSGSTIPNNASLILAADGGRFKASG